MPTHLRQRARAPRAIMVAMMLVVVGCAGQEGSDGTVAASSSPGVAVTTAAVSPGDAPVSADPSTAAARTSIADPRTPSPPQPGTEPGTAAPTGTPVPDTAAPTGTPAAAAGPFCDELETFMDAWVADEIPIPDLTDEYRRLGAIAPDDLPDHFETLARGNEEVLADGELSDRQAYDASGAAVATYAMQGCGIQLEN